MSRAPVLSAAEEVALAKRIERGDLHAKEKMIESNVGLVHTIARMHRGSGVPFGDLVQEGAVGLVRAVERFDHRRGLKFSTYAVWWIRRSILDAIAAANVIRIPEKATRHLAAVRRAEAELAHHASDAEIAARIDLGEATVRSLRSVARVTASLDEAVGEDARSLGDLVADERAVDPSESLLERESLHEVGEMLRLLPARHREVLSRRYGLDGVPESHKEIGASLGVGPERSRQLEREALNRLRSMAKTLTRAA
jgi:RNA polymerase primary sigma factor